MKSRGLEARATVSVTGNQIVENFAVGADVEERKKGENAKRMQK
jgi:hypothetical protein